MERRPAHRVHLLVLEDRGGALAVEREFDHRAGGVQRMPELALGDLERDRLAAAPVQDSGHEALAAQAARRAGMTPFAVGDGELRGLLIGHERRVMVAGTRVPTRSGRGAAYPNCFAALKIRSTSKNAGLGTPSKLTRPFWCSGGCGRGFPPSQPGRTRNSCRAK